MIVVSNTSPINNLAAINYLNLLRELYNGIIIPEAVNRELTGVGTPVAGATEVQTQNWIQTRQVANRELVNTLRLEIDEGEAEAITLAIELSRSAQINDLGYDRHLSFVIGKGFGYVYDP